MSFGIQDNIVRFEISEDNHIFMQGLKSQNKLADILPSFFLGDDSFFADKFAKISSWIVVHNKEKFGAGLEGKDQFDHEGMIDDTHNIALGQGISFEIFGHNFIFAENFHGI